MKKKLLAVLFTVAAAACLCFGLAGCGKETPKPSGGTEQGGTEQGGGTQTTECTVTFDANGGTFSEGTTITQKVKENGKLSAPVSPTRLNYTFAGWTKTRDGADLWSFGDDKVTGDTTLYAAWDQESAILLSVEGANIEGKEVFLFVSPETEEVDLSGSKVVCSADSAWHLYRKGDNNEIYTKTAEALVGGNNEFRIVVASRDGMYANTYRLTVHRKYQVEITYMTNGTVYDTKETMTGVPLTKEEYDISCTVKGYTFHGWDCELGFGETILAPVSLTADLTANKYKFAYDANGGTGSIEEAELDMDTVVNVSSGEVFSRNNYELLSFNTQPDGMGEEVALGSALKFDCAEDLTLYAIWDCDYNYRWTYSGIHIQSVKRQKTTVSLEGEIEGFPIVEICSNAFSNDTELRELVIPKSVETIAEGAFSGCKNLTFISIAYTKMGFDEPIGYLFGETRFDGAMEQEVGSNVYYIPSSLTRVALEGSEFVPEKAFENFSWLKSVSIPSTVTSIGPYAFAVFAVGHGASLRIDITDLEAWCKIEFDVDWFWGYEGYSWYLYVNDSEVVDLQIPTGITEIKQSTFRYNKGLKSVKMGNDVLTLGMCAFVGCENLTNITLGDRLAEIGRSAFSACSQLNNVEIPDSVTEIGDSAFNKCERMTEVKIPRMVTHIGEQAFNACTGLERVIWEAENCIETSKDNLYNRPFFYGCTKLTTLVFGENVKTIPAYAFKECKLEGDLRIPASVTSIGKDAFYSSGKLDSIYISDLAAWCRIDFANKIANPLWGSEHLYLNDVEVTALTIPKEVTEIKSYAFCSNGGWLKSVTIHDSVISIGDYAFSYNELDSRLESITVDKGNQNYSSQDGILYNKEKTEFIHIPYAIKGSVTIPDGVTSIGDSAFYGCSGLTNIIIPDSVTTIGNDAFRGCSGLESVTIGSGVTSIGERAFEGCNGLKSVTLGSGVTKIKGYAFNGCSKLESVYYKGTPSQWSKIDIGIYNRNFTEATRYYFSDQMPTEEQWSESSN